MLLKLYWRNGEQALEGAFAARVYELTFENHGPLSATLRREPDVENSALALLRQVYGTADPTLTQAPPVPDPTVDRPPQPTLLVPGLDMCCWYQLLALEASLLQDFVQRVADPGFTMAPLLLQFCQRYKCCLETTFPSMAHDVSNRPTVKTTYVMESDTPHIDFSPEDDPLVDNEALLDYMLQGMKKPPRKKPRQSPRRDERQWGRLIPVMLLPLVLDLLPPSYQCCNNTVNVCVNMQARIDLRMVYQCYPSYMHDQTWALRTNTMYLASVYQNCAQCTREEARRDTKHKKRDWGPRDAGC